MRQAHGLPLLVRRRGVRVDAEHERQEQVQETLGVLLRHLGEEPAQAARQRPDRPIVRLFEGHQVFQPGVGLHIVQVHGHQFQQAGTALEGAGQRAGKLLRRQRLLPGGQGVQVRGPCFIFPLGQGQEDLLPGLEVIVDRSACKRRPLPDLLESDVPEAHRLIQLRAGVDDLVPAGLSLFFRAFWHSVSLLSEWLLVAL